MFELSSSVCSGPCSKEMVNISNEFHRFLWPASSWNKGDRWANTPCLQKRFNLRHLLLNSFTNQFHYPLYFFLRSVVAFLQAPKPRPYRRSTWLRRVRWIYGRNAAFRSAIYRFRPPLEQYFQRILEPKIVSGVKAINGNFTNEVSVNSTSDNTIAIVSRVLGFSAVPLHLPSKSVPLNYFITIFIRISMLLLAILETQLLVHPKIPWRIDWILFWCRTYAQGLLLVSYLCDVDAKDLPNTYSVKRCFS